MRLWTNVDEFFMKMNIKLNPQYIAALIGLLAFSPVVFNIAIRHYYGDILAIGTTTNRINELEIQHHRVDGMIYKLQGFAEVDPVELEIEANKLLSECKAIASQSWYQDDGSFADLQKSIQAYCDVTAKRVDIVDDYELETRLLKEAMVNIPPVVRQFHNDPNELRIEDIERAIVAHALKPLHWSSNHILEELKNLKASRYEEFRGLASDALAHSNNRANLIIRLIDPAAMKLATTTKQIHFTRVLLHQKRSEMARELLFYVSIVFASLITIIFYRLRKTTDSLADLNHTLEEKVDERTKELQGAMDQLADQQSYLAQSAKMSALGEMAGGIAHEINTPLAAISLTAELLQANAEERKDNQTAEGLSTITSIVERISKIVQGLKRFARGNEDADHVPTAVSQVLDDTLMLCSEKLKARGVKLEVARLDRDSHVICAPEQISQVLINLLNNSVDAIDSLESTRKWIRLETNDQFGIFTLRLIDGGEKITDEVRAKLMQPFFTTKQIGKGTGLGLSISKGIMSSHQGTLEFDANAQNTTFVMTMPSLSTAHQRERTPVRSA